MARLDNAIVAFNRGIVSTLALARVDLKRMALSAQTQKNWMPRALGSMMLRPGLKYIGASASNLTARYIPFVYSTDDTALLEFTANLMRVWISDALITRPSVTSAVTNGSFDTDVSGWTDNDEAGGTSVWVTGGYMGLTGNGAAAAIRDQTVTVSGANVSVEHALRIVIHRGPVILRVGTSTTDDSYVRETELQTGTHSLAFTPTGDFNIRFMSRLKRQVLVNSCTIEASGTMAIPAPWGASDLDKIRAGPDISQSADVVFVACQNYTQRRIERRSTRSWSVVQYFSDDGPFIPENVSPITMTAAATSGNTTLTASAAYFLSTHAPSANNAGALFRLTAAGQNVSQTITAQNTFTNAIEVTGVDSVRNFGVIITGLTATGSTVTLQRSLESNAGPWIDFANYTADTTSPVDDGLDNQIVWYRIGVKTGNYVAGTISASLTYNAGTTTGIARVTGFTSSTVVDVEVIEEFGLTTATDVWSEGQWSDRRGWPSSCALYESRLGWAGKDKVNESISDAFNSFDDGFEGDAGTISRSIGTGPVDVINWMLPLQRLILGGQSAEHSCRSNAFDEPLTPSNFNIKPASTQGSAAVQAAKIDNRGVYVQRGGTRIFELALESQGFDYESIDLSMLCPEIGKPSITRIAVVRQPDTRIHCVRSDGIAAVLVYDKRENVLAWVTVETDGTIEDVAVLPSTSGSDEDQVYYLVKRTINGSTVRYLEKWAMESECVGGTINKQADSFVTFTNSYPQTTISGLTHLIGETVVVWQDGMCPEDASGNIKTFVVNGSGQITVDDNATTGIVGLPYDAEYLSAKLGQALAMHKRVDQIGLVLANTHAKGLRFGNDFTTMDYLPLMFEGAPVDTDRVYEEFDQEMIEFPGDWNTDSRIALKAAAPRPCTVMAAIVVGEVYG